ncbi:unnamed protein product [Spirodela intermedia]|uniref:Post-GPI attachment to proteins factor 3 n=1 Tax=Spirodela intermedia TaxID=51605 RepID=A0A7I8K3T6_SPIIN|nr:unnamed protein product [Spirodela intermedia]
MARPTGWLMVLALLGWLVGVLHAGAGDADPLYISCVERCERAEHCQPSSAAIAIDVPRILHMWREWTFRSDCRRSCVAQREMEREELGLEPLKYHGKWPQMRSGFLLNMVSAALPGLNLIAQLYGWLSFLLLRRKSPCGTNSYEYAGLWHIQGLLATNAWFWSSIFHVREFAVTERLAYSAAVALVGYSLVLSIVRTFNLRNEESRVIVASPVLGFAITHIFYLNYAELDYGWNKTVCAAMGVAQLLLWSTWAGRTRHPSRYKMWAVGAAGGLAVLIEVVDFPPRGGFVDGHTLCHAIAIPLTHLWWSFARDDALLGTSPPPKKKTK